MGKPKSGVWKNFIEDNSNPRKVTCKYCGKTYKQGVATRMQNHLNDECNSAPYHSKKSLVRSTKNTVMSSSYNASKERNYSNTLDNSMDTMSETEQKKLEIMLAKALYTSDVSSDFIENPYMVEFFKQLRPSFKLPNKETFSNELLDSVYDESKYNTETIISNSQDLTLVSDCWNNIGNESALNFVICAPSPIFYNVTYFKDNYHTPEWVSNQISNQIQKIGADKFCSVITDTASYMIDAWKILEHKYPHIICSGNASHVVNLLIDDIIKIDQVDKTIESSKSIVKFFKQHNLPLAKFEKLTRWDSHLECLQSLQSLFASKADIQKTMNILKVNKINAYLNSNCSDSQFWDQLRSIIMILEPITGSLKIFESDESVHSSIFPLFNSFCCNINEIDCQFKPQVLDLITKRYTSIYKDSLAVAYLLDPKYYEESKKLVYDATVGKAFNSFFEAKYPDQSSQLNIEFLKFRNKIIPYDNQKIWDSVDQLKPNLWWAHWPESELKKIAVKLLSIPTSPASAERNFLNVSFIHSKLTEHLNERRAKKLDYIYNYLNIRAIQNKKNMSDGNFNDNNLNEDFYEKFDNSIDF